MHSYVTMLYVTKSLCYYAKIGHCINVITSVNSKKSTKYRITLCTYVRNKLIAIRQQ